MKYTTALSIALFCAIFASSPAFADEEVDCNSDCGDGKKLVSFLDGQATHCVCVDEAQMDETVPNPELEGGNEE